jgi:hypothetical protein
MFVPGAKRASAAGLISDGAGRPGVGEAGGVGEGGGGVGEAGGVGDGGGGAPAVTVRLAEVVVSKNAVIVTDVLFPTANVVIVKLADVWPPGTLTMPGARATFALLVASVTEIPPAGAGALKNTVPVALVPPRTLVGVIVIDWRSGGAFGSALTLTKKDLVTPPAVAKTFPPVGKPVTGLVPMVKLVALFPAGIVTLAGTWIIDGLSVVRLIVPPPAGAGITRATLARPE